MPEAQTGDLRLVVNHQGFGGWTSMRVRRSLEELAGSFSLSLTDQWQGSFVPSSNAKALPLNEGDACKITIDGKTVLSGYVDDAGGEYDEEEHQLDVVGRSKAGDLCDCSAIFKTGRWTKRTVKQIAEDLCAPFDIDVIQDVDVGSPLNFALETGETVYSALDRVAKLRGVLVTSNADGDVVLTRAGQTSTKTQIALGVNVKRSSKRCSWKDRFSNYTLIGQSQGTDDWNGTSAAHIKATSTDSEVADGNQWRPARYRPLVVNLSEQGTVGLDKHVKWEANVRAGRSRRYVYRVQGWYCAEGIWTPNVMTHVTDSYWGLDEDLLIVSVELSRDEEGTFTELELTPRAAFDLIAFPKRKQRRKPKRNEVHVGTTR